MKQSIIPILFVFILLLPNVFLKAQIAENQIVDFIRSKKAIVGYSILTDKNEQISYNDEIHFPLLSVFKFHIALAVLDKMDKQNISLDSMLFVKSTQLLPDTYSPLRQKFPNQDLSISLRDLLKYSISLSDNNACDILIDYAGGIEHIHKYINQLGAKKFNLSETEASMHLAFQNVYRNWSTPSEMVRLLKIADEKVLFAPEYKTFLWQTMIATSTGTNKLKGLLPTQIVVGHKTGSSDRTPQGMKIADNDAGLVILPDGRRYYIAVFVMDSYETDESNANIIAQISRMIYDGIQ